MSMCRFSLVFIFAVLPPMMAGTSARPIPDQCDTSLKRSEMLRVQSKEEWDRLLRSERIILFLWVKWSLYAKESEKVVRVWVASGSPPVEVYRVDPDEQDYVMQWLKEQGQEDVAYVGGGGVVWIRAGEIVGKAKFPYQGTPADLDRKTRKAFGTGVGGTGH